MGRRPSISTVTLSEMAGELTRACRLIPSGEEEGGRNKGRVDTGCKWLVQDGLVSRHRVPPLWGPTD